MTAATCSTEGGCPLIQRTDPAFDGLDLRVAQSASSAPDASFGYGLLTDYTDNH